MTRAGQALRKKWQLERLAAQPCACGHPVGDHFELRDVLVVPDPADLSSVRWERHPDHVVGEFHCNHDGCDCILRR